MKGKKILSGILSGILVLSVCGLAACGGGAEKDYEYISEDLSEKNGAELEALADYEVLDRKSVV